MATSEVLAVVDPVVHCDVDWAPYIAQETQLKADESIQPLEETGCKVSVCVRDMLRRGRIAQHSAEWHNMRRCMLTASGIGAICGMDKYCSAEQMFKRKTGQLNHEIPMTAAMMHGNITENEAREQARQ